MRNIVFVVFGKKKILDSNIYCKWILINDRYWYEIEIR